VFGQIRSLFSSIVHRILFSNPKLYIYWLIRKGVMIGEGTWFFGHVDIDVTRPFLVEIGRNCVLTDGVVILTHGYDWAVLREIYGEIISSSGKVILGDNIFVGTNTIILKGTKIGSNTIIGAGSVVTHDIPPNSVAAGNPCQVIMSLEQYYKKRKSVYVEEAKRYAWEIYQKRKAVPLISDFGEELPIFSSKYHSFYEFLLDSGIPEEKLKKKTS
jgi:acetyltransferase-like isoleucine patch superfamily enzyme